MTRSFMPGFSLFVGAIFVGVIFQFALLALPVRGDVVAEPVLIGLDAEFGLAGSTSAQAIERGILLAIDEINGTGGVLGGRPLRLVKRDNRSIPARGIKNIKEFAAMPELVAVFAGRFSPVVVEELPAILESGLLFLVPWSAADIIVEHGRRPNMVFRLSLRDSLAMPKMLNHARNQGIDRVGLLLTSTAWGRSNLAAAERYLVAGEPPQIAGVSWFHFRDNSLIDKYETLEKAGAKAIILVANDDEAALLVREVEALPLERRLPIISHWGVTGGNFADQAGKALQGVDFSVIQTVSLFRLPVAKRERLLAGTQRLFGIARIEEIESPVGFLHAYDLTQILARAIALAGSIEHQAVREALERVENHEGIIKFYPRPFTPERHEALGAEDLLMARYRQDGVIVPDTLEFGFAGR